MQPQGTQLGGQARHAEGLRTSIEAQSPCALAGARMKIDIFSSLPMRRVVS